MNTGFAVKVAGKVMLACWFSGVLCFAALAQQIQLGQEIYQLGKSESGQAWLSSTAGAQDMTLIPSVIVPCVNCHGERGEGSREGGVLAPPVSWHSLALTATDGRGYDQRSFTLAVTMGIGRYKKQLNANMPRYMLNSAELSAMVDYLKVIDVGYPPGVTSTQIGLRLILPDNAAIANAMRETIEDYLELLNRAGGIYSRVLIINPDATVPENSTFESHSSFLTLDLRTSDIASKPQNNTVSTPFVIQLFASTAADQKATDTADTYALYPHPRNYQALKIDAVQQLGWNYRLVNLENLAEVLIEQQSLNPLEQRQSVLIPVPGHLELPMLFSALRTSDIQTNILTDVWAASRAAGNITADYPGAVFALWPPGAESVTVNGRRILAKLSQSSQPYNSWMQQRLWALSAVRLLEACLQKSGRDLTLRNFARSLQSQVDLITEFGPSLSYSADRRIGSFQVALKRIN